MPAFFGVGSSPTKTNTVALTTRNQFKARWHPNETNISAQHSEAGPHSRIQSTNGLKGRSFSIKASSRQRSGEADTVIGCHLRSFRLTERKATAGAATDSRFRRRDRLADKLSFSRVFTRAGRSRDKMFTVLYRPNGTTEPRLGLAIGKKNCRLSTGRNRLKRITRESFRHHRALLGGIDIVVLNQPAAAAATNKALFDSLKNHWQQCQSANAKTARQE